MARHKHADLIHAWAEGSEIERNYRHLGWQNVTEEPLWEESGEYRIKPEKKPDVVISAAVEYNYGFDDVRWANRKHNIKFTFSGETGELIKAEVLK